MVYGLDVWGGGGGAGVVIGLRVGFRVVKVKGGFKV
jgi:hypothetical protein